MNFEIILKKRAYFLISKYAVETVLKQYFVAAAIMTKLVSRDVNQYI